MVQWPHRYCTSLVCFYQLQTVAFVIQTFKILVSLFFPLILPSFCFVFFFLHTAYLRTSPVVNVSIKKNIVT